jgi:hypothetical protein
MTPTYGGLPIFGRSPIVLVQDTDPARQENAYPGINGIESLPMGTRGRFIVVTGTHVAPTPAELVSAQNFFRSFKDGRPRPLMDTAGYIWPWAELQTFDPLNRRIIEGWYGSVQDFRAVFRHYL